MNRPEAKNALSTAMLVAMADTWVEINGNDSIACAILTGAANDFCAGADLKAAAGSGGTDSYGDRLQADPDIRWKGLLRNYTLTKPLITAVEGFAMAGGMELVLASDIRVAAEGAIFALPEARRGLFPAAGGSVRLRRQIPYALAMDLMLTGRRMDAAEAARVGLVTRLVPDGHALAEAKRAARMICDNAPLAIRAIKRAVRETAVMDEDEALRTELEIALPVLQSDDAREGMRAFAEKRQPQFKGS